MKTIKTNQFKMLRYVLFIIAFMFTESSLSAQTQNYVGTSDGDDIKANLTWTSQQSVMGSYYFNANPSRVYKLSGTNYVDGEIEITESFNGKRTGNGTLVKSMTKGRITWSGYINNVDGSRSYFSINRPR